MKRLFCYLGVLLVLAVSGCTEGSVADSVPGFISNDLSVTGRTNKFIVDAVSSYYLWESETNWNSYDKRDVLESNNDHWKFFDTFKYKDDKWSGLTNDIDGLFNIANNIATTYGYNLSFYKYPFANNNEVIAVILYVVPGSPAYNTGLKRGDIIVEMNGRKITVDNYASLVESSSLSLRCGVMNNEMTTIDILPETKHLTAVQMYEDPINAYRIIEKEGKKIGYLCYTGYQIESEKELIRIFTEFKSSGVSEVVLDLRYNSGGYAQTAQVLSSILAPETDVRNKHIYIVHEYNRLYGAYLESNGIAPNELFIDTLSVNMDLKRLYILTSDMTASASEATIVGLKSRLKLIQIGGTTMGKYCGGVLLSPKEMYGDEYKSYYSNFSNWGMYIMVYRFAGIDGGWFINGLAPNIIADEYRYDLKPFGDEDDPLLGRALADILNKPYVEKRSGEEQPKPFAILPETKPERGMIVTFPTQRLGIDGMVILPRKAINSPE